MQRLTDSELLDELKDRLEENHKSLFDLTMVNKKLAEMNEKLRQSELLKTDFLSNVRNEVNNPLNAIIGLANQIVQDAGPGHPITSMAEIISGEALYLNFQMHNIFEAADLEAGEGEPAFSHVNTLSVIHNVLNSFQQSISIKQLQVELIPSQGLDTLNFETDADKLEIITANLLANAIEFSLPEGKIAIRLALDENILVLSVEDQGIGIDEEHQKIIFDRFVQLDRGRCKKHKGHGLGLSIVKALVDMLGGSIAVASNADKGTIFTVTLPRPTDVSEIDTFAEDGNLFIFDDPIEK